MDFLGDFVKLILCHRRQNGALLVPQDTAPHVEECLVGQGTKVHQPWPGLWFSLATGWRHGIRALPVVGFLSKGPDKSVWRLDQHLCPSPPVAVIGQILQG